MRVEASTTIARPVADVWELYAVNHVENHPRWDETIELEATSDAPIGVGTVIKRRVNRFGNVTEGTMEVIEFEPGAVMRVRIQDGAMSIDGFASFQAMGDEETELTIGGEIPGIDESIAEQIRTMMRGSVANIKALIEAET
ncbi:MAG TPA: SRPBCC family protein [Acidimicrobiia bacterium]|nr:SRPBCC family protein [Acidimicrobiia bacterium]